MNFRDKHLFLTVIWLLLMAITVLNAVIAENLPPTLWVTILVACSVCLKGGIVVEHFMGMSAARASFRVLMLAYFVVIPLLVVLVAFFPEHIARITALD